MYASANSAFTHRVSQARADLQDADAVFDQFLELVLCLVVGRVAFEYEVREFLDAGHQLSGLGAVIFRAAGVFFLNARLNDAGDDIVPCLFQTCLLEGGLKAATVALKSSTRVTCMPAFGSCAPPGIGTSLPTM